MKAYCALSRPLRLVSAIFSLLVLTASSCAKDTDNTLIRVPQKYSQSLPELQRIIILGDVQEYVQSDANIKYLDKTLQWILKHNDNTNPITALIQTGDLVNYNQQTKLWKRAKKSIANKSFPYPLVVCTGNHDYTWDFGYKIPNRTDTKINSYFLNDNALFWSAEEDEAWFEKDHLENRVVRHSIGNDRYDILVLEFAPRPEVVEWANKVVKAHPDRKYILLTHEFLNRDGSVPTDADSYAYRQFYDFPNSGVSPRMLWEQLVAPNDNIMCVICGHNGFSTHRFDTNNAGRRVPIMLFNLQYQDHGGDGIVQYWQIPVNGNEIEVKTYNTIKDEYLEGENYNFTFQYRY